MTGVSELITFKQGVSETSESRSKPSVSFDKSCTDIQISVKRLLGYAYAPWVREVGVTVAVDNVHRNGTQHPHWRLVGRRPDLRSLLMETQGKEHSSLWFYCVYLGEMAEEWFWQFLLGFQMDSSQCWGSSVGGVVDN